MLDQLRGRNLAHVGCTLGLLSGLVLGMFGAIAIITFIATASAVNWATATFFIVTFALGAIGYWLGGRYSRRRWGTDDTVE